MFPVCGPVGRIIARVALLVPLAMSVSPARAQDVSVDSGKALYTERCEGCHGRRGQERAMGRSHPLRKLSTTDVAETLEERQTRPAGTDMKDKMKSGLSPDDIRDLSAYIATFHR